MKLKKAFALVLCAVILFSFTSCESKGGTKKINGESEKIISDKKAEILYCKTDSLNPYLLTTKLNRQLSKLLYEPLFKTDNNLSPVKALAKSIDNTDKTVTVKLIDTTFSDGSKLIADDVVYSYNLAKQSNGVYAYQLYEVLSVTAKGNDTVVFELTVFDPYFANLLDLPIIKKDSDRLTDSDGVAKAPIGCGKYKISDDGESLLINDNFYGKIGEIGKIKLINAPDEDALAHYVEVGASTFYYTDLSDGNIARMSGKRADVNLNAFVYIGINERNALLKNKNVRYAISSAINRTEICKSAYYNNATAATGFFAPWFEDTKSIQSIDSKNNKQITVENLDKIGYNRLDKDGYYVNSKGSRLSFSLLVNSENPSRVLAAELISKQLKDLGIEITVVKKSFNEYLSALNSNAFQLYLGEINVLNNMDFSNLCISGGSAAFGLLSAISAEETDGKEVPAENEPKPAEIIEDTPIKKMIDGYKCGQNSITDIASVLLNEMPQIPICYRKGIFFYDSKISNNVISYASDIYFSIENTKYE
ncbi:MAG: ABC transporter substrate-binding protein [Clostridia bacterium]|nr:ABC transporter substrate-binding protein [Clostridia bacterium]